MFDMLDDPTALLRLNSMFPAVDSGLGVSGSTPAPQPATPPLPVSNFGSSQQPPVNFTPHTEAQHHLSDVMAQMPQYQNPSIWRKIGAAIVGGGYGPAAGVSALEEPYNRDLASWKQQVGVAENAARDENTTNSIERQAAYNRAQTSDREQKMLQDKQIADAKAANAAARTEVYKYKAMHPNWVPKDDINGNVVFFNPQNPSEEVDTGVKSNAITPEFRLELEQMRESAAQELTNTKETGANARNAATIAGANQRNDNTLATKGWTFFTGPDGKVWRGNADTGEAHPVEGFPKGVTHVPNLSLPRGANSPYGSTTETSTETPNTSVMHKLFGYGPDMITSKKVETIKTPTGTGPAKSNTVLMTGPDGKDYPIPADKVQDAIQNHQMKIKGGS